MTTTYNVYRNGSLIASGLTSPAYVDTGLTDGTLYTYQVSATVKAICDCQWNETYEPCALHA